MPPRLPLPLPIPSIRLLRFLRVQALGPPSSRALSTNSVPSSAGGACRPRAGPPSSRPCWRPCQQYHAPQPRRQPSAPRPACVALTLTRRWIQSDGGPHRPGTAPDSRPAPQPAGLPPRASASEEEHGVEPGPFRTEPDDTADLPRSLLSCADDDGTVFGRRSSLSAKAATEPRLQCTELDENGDFTIRNGVFKKTQLIAKYGLLPRDLRKIDLSKLPHIVVRPSAILINLLHLKVLIKHDRVLLFDLFGSRPSRSQSAFMTELRLKLRQRSHGGLPYEFRALEVVLTSVMASLEDDFESVREPVMQVLNQLEDDIDRPKLRVLLILSKRVSTFEQRAKLVRDAIEELLEADDDLAAMYLTEKAGNRVRGNEDHTEIELLLESYHKLCDEIVQDAGNLASGIRNTEDIIRAILDANRNALMVLDLKYNALTLGIGTGTFIAGLLGMNLLNHWEKSAWAFWSATGLAWSLSGMVILVLFLKLRRVSRLKMNMDSAHGSTKPVAAAAAAAALSSDTHTHARRSSLSQPDGPDPSRHWLCENDALEMLRARNRDKLRRSDS